MKKTLLIMAAGMASRYGGGKQTDAMGPSGEYLMEYSIADARRQGFNKIVFIIAPSMADRFMDDMAARVKDIEMHAAVQDFSSLPDGFAVPEGRTKPYGTVHAVLSAAAYLTEPFLVINADDFYGAQAYADVTGELDALPGDAGTACMLAYPVGSTLSGFGDVTRGICRIAGGALVSVTEKHSVRRCEDGVIRSFGDGETETLAPDAPASMNIFGFSPASLDLFRTCFSAFLNGTGGDPLKREYVLPTMIDELLRAGKLTMRVTLTHSEWFGVTYREDRAIVRGMLKDRPLR